MKQVLYWLYQSVFCFIFFLRSNKIANLSQEYITYMIKVYFYIFIQSNCIILYKY